MGTAAAIVITAAAALKLITAPEELSGAAPDGESLKFGDVWDEGEFSDSGLTYVGTPFTEEEIEACFDKYLQTFISDLWSDYDSVTEYLEIKPDDPEIRVSKKGYCHIKATDTNTLDFDFMNFPVFIGEYVVADITMFRAEGENLIQIGFGGTGSKNISRIFAEYSDSDIGFVYCRGMEIAVTQDGKAHVLGGGKSINVPDDLDLYSVYATEYNTFNFSEVLENEQYITLRKEDVYEQEN